MGKQPKTPGVYVEEVSATPNSIAQVETAIPVFIGYTEKALHGSHSLLEEPTLITSLSQFEQLFGGKFSPTFCFEPLFLHTATGNRRTSVITIGTEDYAMSFVKYHDFYLYHSLQLFFTNGGHRCYIVSVGTYENYQQTGLKVSKKALIKGLQTVASIKEPTLVVTPDVMQRGSKGYSIHEKILAHCATASNRFAILDVFEGYFGSDPQLNIERDIETFRSHTATANLGYGAAYYPWLKTQLISSEEISIQQFESISVLSKLLPETEAQAAIESWQTNNTSDIQTLHLKLKMVSPTYHRLLQQMHQFVNELPPSGALAGIYARTDAAEGVWKAPANVSVIGATGPTTTISHQQQEGMNVDASTGKSINAIRSFPGVGTLVWGARTLDGNSNEWRYVPVRRFLSMVAASVHEGLTWAVFEPNDANLWSAIEQSISYFLTDLWRQGGLAGSTPRDGYFVKVGLGSTMTVDDINNHQLIVEIGMAVVRPAEFIILKIQLEMHS